VDRIPLRGIVALNSQFRIRVWISDIGNDSQTEGGFDDVAIYDPNWAGVIPEEMPAAEASLRIEPSPCHDQLTVELPASAATGLASLTLWDIAGRKVGDLWSGELASGTGTHLELSLTKFRLASGAYLIRFGSSSGTSTQAIVHLSD